jgi:hypothetical protein
MLMVPINLFLSSRCGAFGSVLMADYELDRLSSGTRSQHD